MALALQRLMATTLAHYPAAFFSYCEQQARRLDGRLPLGAIVQQLSRLAWQVVGLR